MTSKVYRTAQGKTVDLGTIMLQNEHVRAVGNMNINARGDKLDQNNRVIETKPRQIQRQNARTTNVSDEPVQTSATKAKKARREKAQAEAQHVAHAPTPVEEQIPVAVSAPPVQNIATPGKIPEGGLAAAIARQREVKQELEKTRRQSQQGQGLRKI
jgi:O-acetyl-ADP-ribose deacetylase (regulator of RNase III)